MKLIKSPSEFNTMSDTRRILYAVGILFFSLAIAALCNLDEAKVVHFFNQVVQNLVTGLDTSLRTIAISVLALLVVFHLATAVGMAAVLEGMGKHWSYGSVETMAKYFNPIVLTLFGSAGAVFGGYMTQTPGSGYVPPSFQVLVQMVICATLAPLMALGCTKLLAEVPKRPGSYLTTLNSYSWIAMLIVVLPVGSIALDIVAAAVILMSTVLRPLGYKFRCRKDGVGDNWREHYFPDREEPYAYR